MKTIKFSHTYQKLKHHEKITNSSMLLEVLEVELSNLSFEFLLYDTDGIYELPKKGKYLMLIFMKDNSNIFTTLRRYTPQKEKYYRESRGENFNVEIVQENERLKKRLAVLESKEKFCQECNKEIK